MSEISCANCGGKVAVNKKGKTISFKFPDSCIAECTIATSLLKDIQDTVFENVVKPDEN